MSNGDVALIRIRDVCAVTCPMGTESSGLAGCNVSAAGESLWVRESAEQVLAALWEGDSHAK